MTPEEFARARELYFNRCAGCHGTLRAGATGPNLLPARTLTVGTSRLRTIISIGTAGGMPGWVRTGLMTMEEADLLARFIQLPPPSPPPRPLEDIRASWRLRTPVADRPTAPRTTRAWENFFGVILRDAGRVAIVDGDRHDLVGLIETGFAVHILRSSTTGRYFYAVGRDGRVTLIDLWTDPPSIAATVQGCFDARSVEASRFPGYEDRLLIEGCYWPPQYVVYDGLTLEPRAVRPVLSPAFSGEPLDEVRVASIIASRQAPQWVLALKESGYVALVDYRAEGFPVVARIGAERFLHDGGWDHTGRYFLVAANARNRVAVIDTLEQRLVTSIATGLGPHPGRGVNWLDPTYGWVNATAHMGQGRFSVYGADPVGSPANAWRVVRTVDLPAGGSLFVKSHPSSPWVWIDAPVSSSPTAARRICVYAKATGMIHRCWSASERGQVVHFEYNRAGTEVWVSVWDRVGELIVYNDRTLEEVTRIRGDWLVTPTGKFNVWNTSHDVY
ncbi:MAG: c-type cytochrome [Deltaproteobacteria bacterium]|nr:c-type cytochrome [Deltaproteobacteria bacterium]